MIRTRSTLPSLTPSVRDMEAMAAEALETIPEPFRRYTDGVLIRVEDFPDPEIRQEMGLESPFDLLGLYSGVSLDRRSVSDPPRDVDMIFLYRRPILAYQRDTGENLEHIVRHVLIHEIGHHFGLSDDDMERIEDEE
ncbi:MAG: metallopeptidase family protein [Rhodospirillales bacterium]|nr:metallopeptidase family protein [Rhodospirillales bacterium]